MLKTLSLSNVYISLPCQLLSTVDPEISAAVKLNTILKKRRGPWNEDHQHLRSPGVGTLDLVPNDHVVNIIAMGISNYGDGDHGGAESELDSRANRIVDGEQAYIFSHIGLNANARAFSDEASEMQGVPSGDAMYGHLTALTLDKLKSVLQ